MIFPILESKDPDAARLIQWDLSADVAARETSLIAAEVTEVNSSDDVADPTTVTIGAVEVTASGFVTALVSGGTVGTEVLLRCRYTFANGEIDDATLRLPIRHR